jgi:hypothetical protein
LTYSVKQGPSTHAGGIVYHERAAKGEAQQRTNHHQRQPDFDQYQTGTGTVSAGNYEEVTKELKFRKFLFSKLKKIVQICVPKAVQIADDRYQKVQVELKHTYDTYCRAKVGLLLYEEQERIVTRC